VTSAVTATDPHPDWDRAGANWPHRAASRFLKTEAVHWHYQRMGAGPVLLLLHGSGAATHSWRGLTPLLAQTFDVIAPDLPGHGFSRTAPGQILSLPGMAGAIADLAQALGIRPRVLVGHSAGAAVALQTVLTGALAPQAIVGLNAALTPFRGLAGVLFPPMAKLLALNPVTPWAFARMAGHGQAARRLIEGTGSRIDSEGLALYGRLLGRPSHVSAALAMMASWDLDPLLEALSGLTTPTHLIVGLEDRAVPPDEARRLAAQHPFLTLEEAPELGHLMHEERPDLIAEMILRAVGDAASPE
jgi:magnesium chelatase accessory protein